jgi:serine/threonine protein kinase
MGTLPFKGQTLQDLHKNIMRCSLNMASSGLSSDLQNLISGLLKVKPEDRLTIPEILGHPWISSVMPKIDKVQMIT